jgi:hypothetical protein
MQADCFPCSLYDSLLLHLSRLCMLPTSAQYLSIDIVPVTISLFEPFHFHTFVWEYDNLLSLLAQSPTKCICSLLN